MSSLDLNSKPNISEKSSLVTDSHEGFTEFKQYFEKSRLANAEISIFVNRLIAIFEKLLSQLEFAVIEKLITLFSSFTFRLLTNNISNLFEGYFTIISVPSSSIGHAGKIRFKTSHFSVLALFLFRAI